MPWLPDAFLMVIAEAGRLIQKEFGITPKASVFLCSSGELDDAVLREIERINLTAVQIRKIKNVYLRRIIGKFFKESDEIWLLEGKGDNIETLVHELLHSIQKCAPNIENIVDYLTYKLTGSSTMILEFIIDDWSEIERIYGYGEIKLRLVTDGDCEEF